MTRPWRRALVAGHATVLLAAATAWALGRGFDTRPSVGGLLAAPVPVTRVVGGWLAVAAVTATAAVLTGVDAVAATIAARGRGTRRDRGPAGTLGA